MVTKIIAFKSTDIFTPFCAALWILFALKYFLADFIFLSKKYPILLFAFHHRVVYGFSFYFLLVVTLNSQARSQQADTQP